MSARRHGKEFFDDRELIEDAGQREPGPEQVVRADERMPLLAQVHEEFGDVIGGARRQPGTGSSWAREVLSVVTDGLACLAKQRESLLRCTVRAAEGGVENRLGVRTGHGA